MIHKIEHISTCDKLQLTHQQSFLFFIASTGYYWLLLLSEHKMTQRCPVDKTRKYKIKAAGICGNQRTQRLSGLGPFVVFLCYVIINSYSVNVYPSNVTYVFILDAHQSNASCETELRLSDII